MNIVIEAKISQDRRLIEYELPPDAPVGRVRLIIQPIQEIGEQRLGLTREEARARLLAGGALNTNYHAPEGAVDLSDEELDRLGRLAPGARSSDDLINEDRGEY